MNEAHLQLILEQLSAAFSRRDVDGLVRQFSPSPAATYAGSEAGETATGSTALRHLFSALFARPEVYSFTFSDLVFDQIPDCVWILADGHGVETRPGHAQEVFAYRISGVLVLERDQWRWALLVGTEPTSAVTAGPGG